MKLHFLLITFFVIFATVAQGQERLATVDGKDPVQSTYTGSKKNTITFQDSHGQQYNNPQLESLTPGEGFESAAFPPAGWDTTVVNPGVSAPQRWSRVSSATVGSGAFGLSFGAARFDFWGAPANSIHYLQTANFTPTVAGEVFKFDWAYAPYVTTARDSMIIQTSTDGTNFTNLLIMWGDTTSNIPADQNMITAQRNSSQFVPTDAQWATRQLVLPVGTIAIRLLAISGNGNHFYIDNMITFVPGAAMTGAYTINFGSPTGGTNFQTFRDAAYALNTRGISGPVTFNVTAGTYGAGNRFILNPVAGSSSTNRIIFQNSGGSVTIADTGTASTSDYGIMLSGCDWVTVNGINVSCAGTVTAGLLDRGYYLNAYRGMDGARNNTLQNATVTLGGNGAAPTFSAGVLGTGLIGGTGVRPEYGGTLDSNKIQSMKINRADRGIGFFVPTAVLNIFHSNIEISGCVLGETIPVGSTLSGTSPAGYLIQGVKNAMVFNNRIDSLRNAFATSTGAVTGISMQIATGRCYNNVIRYIRHANPTTGTAVVTGIQSGPWNGEEVYVYNNLITGLSKGYTGAANGTYGVIGINPTNFVTGATATTLSYIYNNTVLLGGTADTARYSTVGISLFAANLPVFIRNNNVINNFTNAPTDTTAKHFAIADPNTLRTLLNSNYNNLYVTGNNAYVGTIGAAGFPRATTVANWKALSTGDTNSVSGAVVHTTLNPLTVDPTIAGNWVVNGKGTALSMVTTDINGTARNTSVSQGTTDIGADEVVMASAPPFATESAAPSAGGTSVYTQFGDTVCIVTWGTGGTLPTGLNVSNFTGENPPAPGTRHFLKGYVNATQVGGPLAGTTYDMTLKFGTNMYYNTTTPSTDLRVAKRDAGNWVSYLAAGTGALQSDLNTAGRRITVRGLSTLSDFAVTDITAPLTTIGLAPNLLQPANNVTNVIPNNPVIFRWNKSIEGTPRPSSKNVGVESSVVSNYWFELNTDTAAAPIILDSLLTDTTKTVPSLTPLTPYFWRVRAKNQNGWGPYSGWFKFTTTVASGITTAETLPTEFKLYSNYPNPFNPSTTIKFDIPENAFVTMKVFDISGREVAVLLSENMAPGRYEAQFNGSAFASGVYFYKISAGTYSKVFKMILTK